MGRETCRGFARLSAGFLGDAPRGGAGELREAFAEGDGLVERMAFRDLELAGEDADGATFDTVAFRSCQFEDVDFRGCTFRDVLFEGCRFIGCTMDAGWLNRVDVRDCSAPGLSLVKARIASVRIEGCDLSYANLSEASVERLCVHASKLREAALQRARLKHVTLDGSDLTRLDVFGTRLAGVDFSTCVFQAPVLSADFHELRGAVVAPEQAIELARLLGVSITDE